MTNTCTCPFTPVLDGSAVISYVGFAGAFGSLAIRRTLCDVITPVDTSSLTVFTFDDSVFQFLSMVNAPAANVRAAPVLCKFISANTRLFPLDKLGVCENIVVFAEGNAVTVLFPNEEFGASCITSIFTSPLMFCDASDVTSYVGFADAPASL